MTINIDVLSSWAKRKGFLYPGSEIYGGLSNAWDFGPYGVLLKNNIKDLWWKEFVQKMDNIIGVDSQILMNQQVWHASGHVAGFNDPLMDCKKCKNRFRADKLIEEYIEISGDKELPVDWAGEGTLPENLMNYIINKKIKCPKCGELDYTSIRKFNLMFKTYQGVLEEEGNLIYLRPETCQGIFTNYKNVLDTMRIRVPFGLAQVGKAFRNEITPGRFIYRQSEFEQMEIEFFTHPTDAGDWYQKWMDYSFSWRNETLGIPKDKIRARQLPKEEAAHYSDATHDFEYLFPWGWGEIQALNNRTDFDLTNHQKYSGINMQYTDPKTGKRYIPYVIEASFGLTRTTFVIIANSYSQEEYISKSGEKESRVVLKFPKNVAPIKFAVLPLIEKNEDMMNLSKKIYDDLKINYMCEFDSSGNVGKRYRRQDEIGTPYCITVDYDSIKDGTVTLRDRDTMEQIRIKPENIVL